MTSKFKLYVPPGTTVSVADQAAPPVPAPTISNASAAPASLPAGGGAVVINATVTDATLVTLDGAAVTLPKTVNVTTSRAFVLVAHGATAPDAQVSIAVAVAAPPVVVDASVTRQPLAVNGSGVDLLAFWRYCSGERYDRMQSLVTVSQAAGAVRMIATKLFSGEPLQPNGVTVNVTLTPVAGGAPVAVAPRVANGSVFDVATPTLAQGWYRATAIAGTWQTPAWYVYVPGAGPLPAMMPVVRANWDMMHPSDGVFTAADCIVPAKFDPVTVPYPARTFVDLPAVPSRAACVETHPVIARSPDVYRPSVASTSAQQPEGGAYSPRPANVAGLMTTFNRQCYFYGDLIGRETPIIPLLDGARGRGTVYAAQHLQGGRNGKILFVDNWRHGRIDPDGTVKTLIGPYDEVPTLWTDVPAVSRKLAGDWSAVAGAHAFNESWGMAYWLRTLAIDPTAPLVNGEPPHVKLGPVSFHPDRHHKRIIKGQFNGGGDEALALFGNRDRDAPAKVTEWITSAGPWDCVTDGGDLLIVSEHDAARIAVYNMNDRSLVQTIAMPTASPFPEGLFYQDGVLFYACVAIGADGALTGGEIRKRSLGGSDSPHIALSRPWIIDDNSRFAKIALSDGTFGPRGMLGLATWSGNGYGYPLLFMPTGAKVSDSIFPGDPTAGPGLPWKRGSYYPSSCGFAQGRFIVSTMQEGIRVISKANPSDANLSTPGFLAGAGDYAKRGYRLTNGDDGFGFYGLPQKWGVTPQIDEYLQGFGHVKP